MKVIIYVLKATFCAHDVFKWIVLHIRFSIIWVIAFKQNERVPFLVCKLYVYNVSNLCTFIPFGKIRKKKLMPGSNVSVFRIMLTQILTFFHANRKILKRFSRNGVLYLVMFLTWIACTKWIVNFLALMLHAWEW